MEINGDFFWANVDNYQTSVRDRVLLATYLAKLHPHAREAAELEVRWAISDGLHLDTALTYDEVTYTSFHSAPCGTEWTGIATSCDLTGKPFPARPVVRRCARRVHTRIDWQSTG